ncbi:MAG: hypothetical protein ACR2PA_06730 [Hyphomicrobiaceae bacterium]
MRLTFLVLIAAGLAGFLWLDNTSNQGGAKQLLAWFNQHVFAPADSSREMTRTSPQSARTTHKAAFRPASAAPAAIPFGRIVEADIEEIVSRPLFSKSRRPPPPVKPPPRPAPPKKVKVDRAPPMRLLLVGVISAANGGSIALLRERRTRKEYKAKVGDTVSGWKVERIELGLVNVRHKRWNRKLRLHKR